MSPNADAALQLRSSGTTGQTVSRHLIYSTEFYRENAERCFGYFFGNPEQYHSLALLPSYLERSESSLVVMMQVTISAMSVSFALMFRRLGASRR